MIRAGDNVRFIGEERFNPQLDHTTVYGVREVTATGKTIHLLAGGWYRAQDFEIVAPDRPAIPQAAVMPQYGWRVPAYDPKQKPPHSPEPPLPYDYSSRGQWHAWKAAEREWQRSDESYADPDKDPAVQPKHYLDLRIEPIRFGVENYGRGVLITKIVKYITRAPAKNGSQDMAKAKRCLSMLTKFDAGDADWWKPE